MRADWRWLPLGDICQTGAGGTPLKENKKYYENGTIPWLMSGEVAQGEIHSASNFITQEGLDNSAARIFPRDTVLIAMYGATAGQVGILRFEAATNQAVCGIPPNGKFLPEFLYYFFLFRKDALVAQAAGNAQPNISQIKIRNTPVPLIPIPEQKRIVAILDKAFAAIAIAKANAKKNLLNARALFRQQLEILLRRENGDRQLRRLGDVCAFINGRAYSKDELLERGKYPVLRVGNFFTNEHWYYSDLELDRDKYCDSGDLLYAWSASFGPRIWTGPKVIYHYHIWKVVPNSETVSKGFLKYLLEWDVQQVKQAHGTGTTMTHVGKASMENRRLPIPPLADQREIVSSLDQLNERAVELQSGYQQRLIALEDLKKSTLNRAFAGNL